MDQQAANLLAALRRTSASAESKLTQLNTLKSDIKHYRVPDNAQTTIFECLKLAISQQTSTNIVNAAFSTLGHLIKRLKIQDVEGAAIAAHAPRLWPVLQDRLGDSKEGHRAGASQAFSDFWPFCAHEVEHVMRDEIISSSNARAKEMAMDWVVTMNQDAQLQFKSFVPPMVACLEDADGAVRDAAKRSLVELFRAAPDRAKADLKKQLQLQNVRSSISDQILSQIGISQRSATSAPEVDLAASTRSLPAQDHLSHFAESINSEDARPPPQEEVPMDPIFVHSYREVEDIFRDMAPHFEGKETEENWLLRDKDILKLRRLTKGNAPSDHHTVFMAGLKNLQDGTLKAANTLRTTMATNGCLLVQELARTLGPALDSMAEIYLQSFIKMSAATKHIAAQHGATTTDMILQYVTYNKSLMAHVWAAATDKNKQPRQFAAGWLRTLLNKQAGSKSHFESSGGLELAEKTIKKGLDDADPKVKENMRVSYWTYAKLWPSRAEKMISSLDPKARVALEKDSHNPNASHASTSTNFAASTSSRASGARSALRDRIAAARNAAKTQPPRPATSMATSTPARSPHRAQSRPNPGNRAQTLAPTAQPASRVVSNASTSSTATARSVESTSSNSSTATMRPHSLMSGAARRPVRRPELTRPATADPHAPRNMSRPETPSSQAYGESPRQTTLTKPTAASSAKTRVDRTASPAPSPIRANPGSRAVADSRPASRDDNMRNGEEANFTTSDDFTMELPTRSRHDAGFAPAPRRPTIDKTMSVDTGISTLSGEDNFTMVMPNLHNANGTQREHSPLAYRGPGRSISEEASGIPLPPSSRSSVHGRSPPLKSQLSTTHRSPSLPHERERSDSPASERPVNGFPRQGSPLKTFSVPVIPQEEDVHIYEDPFTADISPKQNGSVSPPRPANVLSELPVNESNTGPALGHSPAGSNASASSRNGDNTVQPILAHTNGNMSPPRSPQSKSESLRSRKLLQSGIERIKARTLDTHGFRKVLDLTRNNEALDLFASHTAESKRYDELMAALCSYVTVPSEALTNNSSHNQSQTNDLKRQAFTLLRSLITNQDVTYKKWNASSSWHARSLTAALSARRTIDGLGIVVKDLEALTTAAVAEGRPDAIFNAITDFLTRVDETEESSQQNGVSDREAHGSNPSAKSAAHATALALRTLSAALPQHPTGEAEGQGKGAKVILTESQRRSVVDLTARYLRSRDAEVRKADVELATTLYGIWPVVQSQWNNGNHDGEDYRDGDYANGGGHGIGDEFDGRTGGVDGSQKLGFWTALERTPSGLQESTRNLIVYFIARREGRAG